MKILHPGGRLGDGLPRWRAPPDGRGRVHELLGSSSSDPQFVQGELSFCFVYKFRQRFGIVADAISRGLGRDTKAAVQGLRQANMYMNDLSCCENGGER